MTKRSFTTLTGAAVLLLGSMAPAGAGPAQHGVFTEDYDNAPGEHLAADENPCGDWAVTFHEVRTGQYKVVAPGGRRHPDEIHVNGIIHGLVELVPDDPSRASYAGTYREKSNGSLVATDDGDVERVTQYRLRTTLRGTDGSVLTLRLSGKTTTNGHGETVVDREHFSCA